MQNLFAAPWLTLLVSGPSKVYVKDRFYFILVIRSLTIYPEVSNFNNNNIYVKIYNFKFLYDVYTMAKKSVNFFH